MSCSLVNEDSLSARIKRSAALPATALFFGFSVLFMFLLHPRLGIRDGDAFAYIMGGALCGLGAEYRSLIGEAFNHWPPGYSLLLSLFPDPSGAGTLHYVGCGILTHTG
jgi:hypothetical protein